MVIYGGVNNHTVISLCVHQDISVSFMSNVHEGTAHSLAWLIKLSHVCLHHHYLYVIGRLLHIYVVGSWYAKAQNVIQHHNDDSLLKVSLLPPSLLVCNVT